MKIGDHNVPVDVLAEIEPFMDRFRHVREGEGKISMASPFREDNSPSFVLFTDGNSGNWVDLGNALPGYERGGFVKLLAYLMGTDSETAKRYLLKKYLAIDPDTVSLHLKLELEPPAYPILDAEELLGPLLTSDYLSGRGIYYQTQRAFHAGYHPAKNAVALPWFDYNGELVAVKYRSVEGKSFVCADGGQKVHHHIFGYPQSLGARVLYVTEAEIDAMYMVENGFNAVALGTAHMSDEQRDLLIRHPAHTIIIATDNDAAGHKCAARMTKALTGYKNVGRVIFPDGVKDMNDIRPLDFQTYIPPILSMEAPK